MKCLVVEGKNIISVVVHNEWSIEHAEAKGLNYSECANVNDARACGKAVSALSGKEYVDWIGYRAKPEKKKKPKRRKAQSAAAS